MVQAYAAACKAELARTLPASSPDDEDEQLIPSGPLLLPVAPATPLQRVVKRLQDYRPKGNRSVNASSQRTLKKVLLKTEVFMNF